MTITDGELLQRFIALEEREGWWNLEAYGQPYWHQIRFVLLGLVKQALGRMDRPHRSWRDRPLSSWLANMRPAHWPHAVRRSLWNDMAPADVLIVNHPRHVPRGGEWICPYTQPLLEGFAPSYWLLEDVWQGVHSFPQPRDVRLKYLEWPLLLAQVGFLTRHALTGGRLNAAERATVGDWRQLLEHELGGAPSRDKALAITRAAVREVAALRGLYERLLDRVRPKLVVVVVGYSYRCITLTSVARERGIPVAELQHGTMGGGHLAYNMHRHQSPSR